MEISMLFIFCFFATFLSVFPVTTGLSTATSLTSPIAENIDIPASLSPSFNAAKSSL